MPPNAVPMIKITKENEHEFVTQEDCKDCPHDSACSGVKDSKGANVCLCYHFGKEPLRKGTECPRKIVKGVRRSDFVRIDGDWSSMVNKQSGIPVPVLQNSGSKLNQVEHPPMQQEFYLSQITTLGIFIVLIVFILKLIIGLKEKTYNKKKIIDSSGESGSVLSQSEQFVKHATCLDLAVQVYSKEEINLKCQIGEGCFGKVFKGDLKGEKVAVKVFKKYSDHVVQEIETMSGLSHTNILPLVGIVQHSESEPPWIIFELMEYGDLHTLLINSCNTPMKLSTEVVLSPELLEQPIPMAKSTTARRIPLHITNDHLLDFALQISEGMDYLASHRYVHRDLAARNCLVSAIGVIKISDFGLSRDVYTTNYYKVSSESKRLPLRWMSPESIIYGKFTTESDIYSYGVVLWELFSRGRLPYYGLNNEQALQRVLEGSLLIPPPNCPNIICEIMASCWRPQPKDRPKFIEIKNRLMNADCGKDMECASEIIVSAPEMSECQFESGYEIPVVITAAVLNTKCVI